MKTRSMYGSVFATFIAALSYASTASAEGTGFSPIPIDGFEVAMRVGGATAPSNNPFDGTNPYGFGLGGRAGISFYWLYAGFSGLHYFGGSGPVIHPPSSVSAPTPPSDSIRTSLVGGEFGVTLPMPFVKESGRRTSLIRPQLGLGNASVTSPYANGSTLYLEPGVLALFVLGDFDDDLGGIFVGADFNVLVLPNVNPSSETAFSAHVQTGVRF